MRALRFAVTLDFQLSDELEQSLHDSEIIQLLRSLTNKVGAVERKTQNVQV